MSVLLDLTMVAWNSYQALIAVELASPVLEDLWLLSAIAIAALQLRFSAIIKPGVTEAIRSQLFNSDCNEPAEVDCTVETLNQECQHFNENGSQFPNITSHELFSAQFMAHSDRLSTWMEVLVFLKSIPNLWCIILPCWLGFFWSELPSQSSLEVDSQAKVRKLGCYGWRLP